MKIIDTAGFADREKDDDANFDSTCESVKKEDISAVMIVSENPRLDVVVTNCIAYSYAMYGAECFNQMIIVRTKQRMDERTLQGKNLVECKQKLEDERKQLQHAV